MRAAEFLDLAWRLKRGSITRRHFLGASGLATAMAALGLRPGPARAGEIGDRVGLCTWPSYHDPANLAAFEAATGAAVALTVFGSNEEMLAKLQAGAAGFDVMVPSNFAIPDYVGLGLLRPLDAALLPHHDPAQHEPRFLDAGLVDGRLYGVPKNWGHSGFVYDSRALAERPTTWREFWDLARGPLDGRVLVNDYQITTVGFALKYFGHSFNSLDPAELAEAERLLLAVKPHLFGITSDYKPLLLAGEAAASICWSGDGLQLRRENPALTYEIGREGGEIWADYYCVPADAPNPAGAHALIDFLTTPEVTAREVLAHGYAPTDARAVALLPEALKVDPILFPAAELLTPLEFGTAGVLIDPLRNELFARFKAA